MIFPTIASHFCPSCNQVVKRCIVQWAMKFRYPEIITLPFNLCILFLQNRTRSITSQFLMKLQKKRTWSSHPGSILAASFWGCSFKFWFWRFIFEFWGRYHPLWILITRVKCSQTAEMSHTTIEYHDGPWRARPCQNGGGFQPCPCDFWLFEILKHRMTDRQLQSPKEILDAVTEL
jgi:hypothetical protein